MPENRLEEIVDGESCIMPPATPKRWNLIHKLRRTLEKRLSEAEYHLSCGENRKFGAYVWTPPELLVECFEPG